MWTPNSALLAAEVELLDQAQFLEIHEGGGTWAIQTDVVVGAVGTAAWHFTAPLVANDLTGHVLAGKSLTIDPDGNVFLAGLQTVQPAGWIKVLGVPDTPGILELAQNAQMVVDAHATITAYAGSLVDIFGNTLFENGASWRLKAGATGFVDGNAVLKLAGTDASTLAFLDVSAFAQVYFRATTRCTFVDTSVLFIGINAQAEVQGELKFDVGSRITGVPTLPQGQVLSVAGAVFLQQGGNLNLLPGCAVNFAGTAELKGSPVFSDSLTVLQTATVKFTDGCTFNDGSIRTYNEPQIPLGPNAVQGQAKPTWGPTPPQGQTFIAVDTSGVSILETPVNLKAEVGWQLLPPSHPEVPRFMLIRQKDQTKQGSGVGVWFQNNHLVAFSNLPAPAVTSAALLYWDTTAWTLVFAAGPNAMQN
jgi:hypothetical protein